LLHRALELGVDFIDTADTYGGSEEMIAAALHPYPPQLVIATKGGLERDGAEVGGFTPWPRNGRPEHLKAACESSLRRLRLECVPLYQLHAPDAQVPFAESVGALSELQQAGKVRFVGLSNVTAQQLETARAIVEVVSVQNRYALTDRDGETILSVCEREGIAFIPWYPLAGGRLAHTGGALGRVAARRGAGAGQIAIAWLLARSAWLLPIPGTASLGHLEENLAAASIDLEPEDLAELEAGA
jgi:aryl-alcohol dehydrogenase-like predicted oxidoreductase